ncbi:MAG: M28 family peptidase [Bacteroidia bacterium]|nr:M28 family peptidase [Bacteroidia bacterium]
MLLIGNPVPGSAKRIPFAGADSLRLKKDVVHLSSLPSPRSFGHETGLDSAAAYIEQELRVAGYTPRAQVYDVSGKKYKNIIAYYGDPSHSRKVVGAHYDVCEDQPGADDNASGSAGLLELARMLRKEGPVLSYCVELVFYTLEEPPHFRTEKMGSYIHAKSLSDSNIRVKGMICLEMIGYFSKQKGSQDYPAGILKLFYPTTGNYIAIVGKPGQGRFLRKIKKQLRGGCDLTVKSISAPSFIPGIDFSDHLNYWRFGYNAVMITDTAFYRNKNYHEKTDTWQTLNYGKMSEVVNGIYQAVVAA